MTQQLRRAAFLDRDGVINADHGYVHRPEQFELLPGVPEALRRLRDAGFLLVVVTNQSGIARGYYTEADYEQLMQHLRRVLAVHAVQLDAAYHCPHLPNAAVPAYRSNCGCRKPRPGMILRGIAELGIDAGASALFGDKASDIDAGRAAGIGWCCLVTVEGANDARSGGARADCLAPDLRRGVEALLALR